jgi:molybdopterin/thiamine biosynthesis adenylyltransferase
MIREKHVSYWGLYSAQLAVFGRRGQGRLRAARVHVCGTGGLGSQLLLNLAAAGIGHLTANDPQYLEADNLNRFPTATVADIGRPKIDFLAASFQDRPFLTFETIVAENESPAVLPFYEAADVLICSSNTLQSRIAVAEKAVQYKKPLFDAAVGDARTELSGSIKIWLPSQADWSACPACYIQAASEIRRGEALFFPVIAATAALTSLNVARFICQPTSRFLSYNLLLINFVENQGTRSAVKKRADCVICRKSE